MRSPGSMHAMVYFTAKDEGDAARIARHLLDRRLIACANIFPVRSIYRWRGKLEDTREAVAICKTRRSVVRRAIREARKVHPYEVPCLVSYDMSAGLAAFTKWIDTETSAAPRKSPTRSRGRRTPPRGSRPA